MGRWTRVLGALLLALAANAAWADEHEEEEDAYARTGVYAVIDGLFALDNFQDGRESHPSLGASGRLGWRLHRFWAFEAQLEWTDRFSFEVNGLTVAKLKDNVVATVNAKLYPIGGRFQPYLLFGIGGAYFDRTDPVAPIPSRSDDTDFATRVGVGIDLYGDENLAFNLRAGYVLPAGGNRDFEYASFGWGLMARF